MELTEITALSPVDGRYAARTAALRPYCSEHGLMHRRVMVELRWFMTLCAEPGIGELPALDDEAEAFIERLITEFGPADSARIKSIEARTNHDVKAVEYFLKERFAASGSLDRHAGFLHFACTSEDINNLAYALMLRDLQRDIVVPAIDRLIERLADMALRYADLPMLARTHGQAASPTTLGKELVNTRHRLNRQRDALAGQEYLGKFNGAVGNYNAHHAAYPGLDWPELSRRFVESLGLKNNAHTTQIEPHDWMAELFDTQARLDTVLIDFCRDVWGYISLGYFRQKAIAGEVGSSTMPHKVNPIDFENAEGNLELANALLGHLARKLPLSRWQRDLTDSTTLRSIGAAYGHLAVAFASLEKGLERIEADPARLAADLEANWEVLAEPIQTVMRRYGLANPYERLKELTRGQRLTRQQIVEFVAGLELPAEARERLAQLDPAGYTGYAALLARSGKGE